MVGRIKTVLRKQSHSLHEAAFFLGFFSIVSQLLGLLRDRLFAHYLGASGALDVYYAAFRIPDFLYVSVASLISITVVIPFLSKYINEDATDKAKQFLNSLFTAYVALYSALFLVVVLLMPYLMQVVAPGFDVSQKEQAVFFSRLLLITPLLMGISNLFGSVAQFYKKFLVFSLSPILYNLGILCGLIFLYPRFGIVGVVIGVIIGSFLHLFIQAVVVFEHRLLPRFTLAIDFTQLLSVYKMSVPRMLGLLFGGTILTIFLTALASDMATGSISVFNFALNIASVPVGAIGFSYAVAAFPQLVLFWNKKEKTEYFVLFEKTLRNLIFFLIPLTVLAVVLRAQIVRLLLGSGSFDWSATLRTAAVFAALSFSIFPQSVVLLVVRAYYAQGQTRRPVLVNFFVLLTTLIVAVLFFGTLPYLRPLEFFLSHLFRLSTSGRSVLAVGAIYSVSSFLNAILLLYFFARDSQYTPSQTIRDLLRATMVASFVGGVLAYVALRLVALFVATNTFFGIFAQLAFATVLGVLGICFVFHLYKREEYQELLVGIVARYQVLGLSKRAAETLKNAQ